MTSGESPLSVAIATSTFYPNVGGTEVTVHNLAQRLLDRGHSPVVLTSFSTWLALRSKWDSFQYPIRPLFPKQYAGLQRHRRSYTAIQNSYFSALQRYYDFDVWQSFGTFPEGVSVVAFTAPRNIPHVIRTRGEDIQRVEELDYGMRLDDDIAALIETQATRCDRMIALTDSVVSDCVDIGMPLERVEVIPCGLDYRRFRNVEADSEAVRAKYGFPATDFLFITVGRNHPKKGFESLVRATAVMEKQCDGFHVGFVGDGMSPIERLANEAGVAHRITTVDAIKPDETDVGYRLPPTEVIRLYKTADAVVFPSLLETFGNVNIEALAAGTPLITTDAPGCRDIVEHDVDGLKATAGEPESIASQMKRLLDSPDLRSHLVQNARQSVERNYTWETVVEQYEDVYYDLIAES